MPVQASFVENDHVIEALTTNRADDTFHVSSLPGGITIRLNVRIVRVGNAWGACTALRRFLVWVALTLTFVTASLGGGKNSRLFHAEFEQVWTAGVEVAKEAFYDTDITSPEGRLRFLTGVFRGYRFEVSFINIGPGKTRVEMVLRTNPYVSQLFRRDAWRHGNRYLQLIGEKIRRGQR